MTISGSSDKEAAAKKYQRLKNTLYFIDLAIYPVFLIILQFSGLSLSLKQWASGHGWGAVGEVFLYMSVFFGLSYLVSFPIQFYSGFLIEKRFNLSNLNIFGWLSDELKKLLLSFLLFIGLIESLYALFRAFPGYWWIPASGGWLLLTVVMTKLLPVILVPFFYKTRPLTEGSLKARLLALCRRCGIRVIDVHEILLSRKTKKANAALVGLGSTRRVLIGDTLLSEFTEPEIEMVIAHELGHHLRRHIPKSFIFNLALTATGFYLLFLISGALAAAMGVKDIADVSIFPVVCLLSLAAGLVILPLQNGFSRYHENEADEFALRLLPSKETFLSLMEKLGRQNLADPSPHPLLEFFLYDHPSIPNRIRAAGRFLGEDHS
jgi:STE24 endopeptidase